MKISKKNIFMFATLAIFLEIALVLTVSIFLNIEKTMMFIFTLHQVLIALQFIYFILLAKKYYFKKSTIKEE